jgi:hypothetical protein
VKGNPLICFFCPKALTDVTKDQLPSIHAVFEEHGTPVEETSNRKAEINRYLRSQLAVGHAVSSEDTAQPLSGPQPSTAGCWTLSRTWNVAFGVHRYVTPRLGSKMLCLVQHNTCSANQLLLDKGKPHRFAERKCAHI